MEPTNNKVIKLRGKIQNYAWGGKSFLPEFLNLPNPDQRPFAEYWLGAHEIAPSELILDSGKSYDLSEYIRNFPLETLGETVKKKFGRLPYLLKLLDVKNMLSIQVHPSKRNAEYEFSEENRRGVTLHSPDRNYKDDNHKPELVLALSEFWLLHGFKPTDAFARILEETAELNFLSAVFRKGGYKAVYKTVMEMEQLQADAHLQPLLGRIIPAYQKGDLNKTDENFWAARAAMTYNSTGHVDKGIFSIYFLNLLLLHPGQAIFQDAGILHAYLEGQNVEIMANSDNVIRGGLTPKFVDVKGLIKHVKFEPTVPQILKGRSRSNHLQVYATSAPDFELGKLELKGGENLEYLSHSTEIFILISGSLTLHENQQNEFSLGAGESFLSFDQAIFHIKTSEDSILFRAAVPLGKD